MLARTTLTRAAFGARRLASSTKTKGGAPKKTQRKPKKAETKTAEPAKDAPKVAAASPLGPPVASIGADAVAAQAMAMESAAAGAAAGASAAPSAAKRALTMIGNVLLVGIVGGGGLGYLLCGCVLPFKQEWAF